MNFAKTVSIVILGVGFAATAHAKSPAGAICGTGTDCASGICQYSGCPAIGAKKRCAPKRVCKRDMVDYCDCRNQTRQSSSNCPTFPFAYRGKCRKQGAPPSPSAKLARLNVRQLVSSTLPSHVLRAIVSVEEIYPFLVVEVIKRGATEGDKDTVAAQRPINQIKLKRKVVVLKDKGRVQFSRLKWRKDGLSFKIRGAKLKASCSLRGVLAQVNAGKPLVPACR